jgi:hypothetical protein
MSVLVRSAYPKPGPPPDRSFGPGTNPLATGHESTAPSNAEASKLEPCRNFPACQPASPESIRVQRSLI